MKKLYPILFAIAALNTANGQWITLNSGTINTLNSVYFPAADTGFAVGGQGTILKTTDGGANWIKQIVDSGTSLEGVFFTDVNTGYIAGWGYGSGLYRSIILKTIDGGITWTSQIFDSLTLECIHFPSADTGYAAGWWKGGVAEFLKPLMAVQVGL